MVAGFETVLDPGDGIKAVAAGQHVLAQFCFEVLDGLIHYLAIEEYSGISDAPPRPLEV